MATAPGVTVAPVAVDAVRDLVPMIARAFADDPCFSWIFEQPDRRGDDLNLFFSAAAAVFAPLGLSVTADGGASATLWAPPGRWQTPDEVTAEFGPSFLERYPDRVMERLGSFFSLTEGRHPLEPHYYLAVAATEPARRSQGLGSACIAAVLRTVDAAAMPAYLESSNQRNVALYQRHGFEITGAERLGGSGPPITFMWRPARPSN